MSSFPFFKLFISRGFSRRMGPSQFRIVLRTATGSGKAFPLPAEGVVRFGSERPSQVLIAAPGVLGVHFFIKCAGGKAALIVQDPAAKVSVNGVDARKRLLEPGDAIKAGEAVLVLETVERDALLGETVGGYRIDARIGRGGMGTVYKAAQLSLDRDVALKILSPELTRDEAFVKRFLEEAKAAAKLNHPNVVQVYDAAAAPSPLASGTEPSEGGPSDQLYYFSMEYMPGGTLQQLLDKSLTVPVEKALSIGCDAARALAWAEERGIVHRDVKPANLLFGADGSVKVADLGIAADIDRMMEGIEGLQGAGSPRYMAPEQAQRKGVDHRADIYALGATLFRAIAGRHVFEGEASVDVLKAKLSQDPPRIDSIDEEVPRPVADLLHKMLSRDPARRPRTCAETLAGLEACLAASREVDEDAAEEYEEEEAVGAPLRPRSRRAASPWQVFIGSGAGKANLSVSSLLVVLALAWPMSPPQPDSSTRTAAVSPPSVSAPRTDVSKQTDDDPGVESSLPAEGKAPGEKTSAVASGKGARAPANDVAPVDGIDKALFAEVGSIVKEYRAGLFDARRAMAALEDFKRKHPEPAASDFAERYLKQIRDSELEAGKTALSRLVQGELPKLVGEGDYREAVSKLTKIGQIHPLSLKEVNAEVEKVEEAADAAFQKAESDADRAAAVGDFARAKAAISGIESGLPVKTAAAAAEKLKALQRDEKEFAQLGGPLTAQIDVVRDAVTALDFDRAASVASALPKPANTTLARRRDAAVSEVGLCRSAWEALSAAAKKAGKSTEPSVLFSQSAKELKSTLGSPVSKEQLEGLGLLVLYSSGPERARELLLDAQLGAAKTADYKARLAADEDEYLARTARSLAAKIDELKKGGKATKKEWEALAASILEKIRSSRSQRGYDKARSALAKTFLRARAEVLRTDVPASLFKGKVKSYKPDGSIEIVYEFNSEDDFKDFVPVKGTSSRLELEGKMAKLRGEFRLGRGDVFRNRLGVSAKLPATGYSPQSPNFNVALWTRDDDRVSAPQKRGTSPFPTDTEETPKVEGTPDDYFVFAIGYKARVTADGSSDGVVVRGSGTSVSMPANAIFGGLRGAPLHSVVEGDCLWGKTLSKISGAQTFRIVMASGAVTWTSSSQTLANAKDLRDVQLLKRQDPFMGSVTLFTNGEVLFYDSLTIEGELNPAWVEEQLVTAGEAELKKVEPAWPF